MSNYTANSFEEHDKNTSWKQVYDLIEDGSKVLDIGCSAGGFGAELIAKKHCTVDGVEIDSKDARLAQGRLQTVESFDVERKAISTVFKGPYDYVLFIDVIEHLKDPASVLEDVKKVLAPNGKVVFSIPNMTHSSVRLALLAGDFNYTQTGLLDQTHLHFYDKNEIRRVFTAANYNIDTWTVTSVTYPKELLDIKLSKLGLRGSQKFQHILSETGANIYQHIGVATPNKQGKLRTISVPMENQHEKDYAELLTILRGSQDHVRTLIEEIKLKDQHIASLERTINKIKASMPYRLARKIGLVRGSR